MPRLPGTSKLNQFSKKRNTFSRKVKDNPADEIALEIGDSKQADFQPQAKVMRWSGEVNLSVRRKRQWKNPKVKTENDKVRFEDDDEEVHIYEKPEMGEDGGLEIELLLKTQPASNRFEFSIQTKGLNFYHQPEITDEEALQQWQGDKKPTKAELDAIKRQMRPENVVNSYAVYHATKRDNRVGGMEYKTGKFCHIYRPHITDADGNETWGELNIDEKANELTVAVDEKWLQKAKYPVVVDPTFGYTSVPFGSTSDFGNNLYLSFAELTERASLESISCAPGANVNGGERAKCAIYDYLQNLLFETEEVVLQESDEDNFVTFPFSGSYVIESGQYFLAFFCEDYAIPPTHDQEVGWESYRDDQNYPNLSSSFSKSASPGDRFSIYATYTAIENTTVTPSTLSLTAVSSGATVSGNATATPSTPSFSTSLPTATASGNAAVVASAQSVTASTPVATVTTVQNATVSPSPLILQAVLETPGVETVQNTGNSPAAFSDWDYRFKMTSDNTKVSNANDNLYYDLALAPAEFWNHVKSDGGDIRMTKSDGSTEVAVELVSIDTANETGEIHFDSTGLQTGSDTDWYIYYGNASATEPSASSTYGSEAVWNSNYKFVSHDGSGVNESTANQNDMTQVGTPSSVSGKVGSATEYDGINDGAVVTQPIGVQTTQQFTVACWVYILGRSTSDSWNTYLGYHDNDLTSYFFSKWDQQDGNYSILDSKLDGSFKDINLSSNPSQNTWLRWIGVFDNGSFKWYENGTLVKNTSESGQFTEDSTTTMNIGYRSSDSTAYGYARLNQVLFLNTALSADYADTEHNNQSDPASFWTTGTEESASTSVSASAGAQIISTSVPTPTIVAVRNTSVSVGTQTASVSTPGATATASTNATAEANTLPLAASVAPVTVEAAIGVSVAPSPVSANLSTPDPTVSTVRNITTVGNVMTVNASVPPISVVAGGSVSITANVLTVETSVPDPSVTAVINATALAGVQILSANLEAPTVTTTASVLVPAGVLAVAASVATPTVDTEVSTAVMPEVLEVTAGIPAPSVDVVANKSIAVSVFELNISIPKPIYVNVTPEDLLWTNETRGQAQWENTHRKTATWENEHRGNAVWTNKKRSGTF